jgi:pimeloyl-ACP methyl ester carboxylesterase
VVAAGDYPACRRGVLLDDAAVWRPSIAALHVPDSESRAVDLAGMSGRPQEAGPYTLGRYANDVIAVIAVIDGVSGPVVLVGHSMGTLIAELAAAERPDNVVALALATPMPLAGAHLPEAAVAPFKSVGGCGAARTASASEPAFPGTGVGPHQRSGRTDRARRDSRVR